MGRQKPQCTQSSIRSSSGGRVASQARVHQIRHEHAGVAAAGRVEALLDAAHQLERAGVAPAPRVHAAAHLGRRVEHHAGDGASSRRSSPTPPRPPPRAVLQRAARRSPARRGPPPARRAARAAASTAGELRLQRRTRARPRRSRRPLAVALARPTARRRPRSPRPRGPPRASIRAAASACGPRRGAAEARQHRARRRRPAHVEPCVLERRVGSAAAPRAERAGSSVPADGGGRASGERVQAHATPRGSRPSVPNEPAKSLARS